MRYATYAEFWPYYIGEHRVPACRHLHFAGTLRVIGVIAWCLVDRPSTFGPALLLALAVGWAAFATEARRNAAPELLLLATIAALGHPAALLGAVGAYAAAWAGHFLVEHNRPATFTYPLWSLASDFRMFSHMLRGRLWTGDGREIAGEPLPPGATESV